MTPVERAAAAYIEVRWRKWGRDHFESEAIAPEARRLSRAVARMLKAQEREKKAKPEKRGAR